MRLSRKLIYVSGLLACYSCELNSELKSKIKDSNANDGQKLMIEHLGSIIKNVKPLDMLARVIIDNKRLYDPAKQIIDSYDQFMSILNDEHLRKHFDKIKPEASSKDKEFAKAREIGHAFQEGLDKLFLEENGTSLFTLTKKYGVF